MLAFLPALAGLVGLASASPVLLARADAPTPANGSSLFNTADGFRVLSSNYSQIVVFGDSLSDNGTGLSSLTQGFYPPAEYYFDGRFSNGWVWPEQLARRLGVKVRGYAVGGSTTSNALNPGIYELGTVNLTLPSTLDQITAYLAENTTTPESLASSLHLIWAGGNDILDILNGVANVTGTELAQAVAQGVGQLETAGATAVTVINLPGLEDTPANRFLTTTSAAFLNEFDVSYRSGLLALESNTTIMADTYTAINYVRQYAEDFGLNSTTVLNACQTGLSSAEKSFGLQYTRCTSQDTHLYWDSSHLTTRGHGILADIVAGRLTDAGWVTTSL